MVIRVFNSLLFKLKMEYEHFEKVIRWCCESKVLQATIDLTKKHATCCKIHTVHLQFVPVILLVMVNSFHNCANGLNL